MELISIHDIDHFSNFPLSYGGPTGGKQVAHWAKNEIFSSSGILEQNGLFFMKKAKMQTLNEITKIVECVISKTNGCQLVPN